MVNDELLLTHTKFLRSSYSVLSSKPPKVDESVSKSRSHNSDPHSESRLQAGKSILQNEKQDVREGNVENPSQLS